MGSARHVVQLMLAALCAGAAALCWAQVSSLVDVAPVTEGEPATVSVVYDPPMMFLALVCGTAAGVLVVLGLAGLVRRARLAQYTPWGYIGRHGDN